MALLKEYSYGSKSGNYWVVIGGYPDVTHGNTDIKVALYKNKDARRKDDSNYETTFHYIAKGIWETRKELYAQLKLKPDFSGAKDV